MKRQFLAVRIRAFDAKLKGHLSFGPGKVTDACVGNWKSTEDAVVWSVHVNKNSTFEIAIA